MRLIKQCLNKELLMVCQQSITIDKLNILLASFLPKDLTDYCKVASLSKGCLRLNILSQEYAHKFRYIQMELISNLRTKGSLPGLVSIKITVSPDNQINLRQANKVIPNLSTHVQQLIYDSAQSFTYLPLKKALTHLAKDKKS